MDAEVLGAATMAATDWGESEIRGPVHLFRERLLMRLFRRRLSRGRVLDAGCGSGSLVMELLAGGYSVEAVEFSQAFVDMTSAKIAAAGLAERATVRQGSVTDLDFPDDAFDGLVCGEVLEHVTPEQGGDETAVAGFHRVLKPGGICIASVPLNPRLWDHSDVWAGHVRRYRRAELSELFERHGLTVEKTAVWGFPLGRAYHSLLFGPWLKRTTGVDATVREGRADTRAAGNRALVGLVALALRFDLLFSRLPWGRGIVVCARNR